MNYEGDFQSVSGHAIIVSEHDMCPNGQESILTDKHPKSSFPFGHVPERTSTLMDNYPKNVSLTTMLF